MKYIKFTIVKLIIRTLTLFCCIYLILALDCKGAQRFVVQVAASKTPMNIQYFAKKYNLKDNIRELKSADWNRYIIGSFESYKMASNYAVEVIRENRLSGAFVRIVEEDLNEIDEQIEKKDSVKLNKKENQIILSTDSVQLEPEPSERKAKNVSKSKKAKFETKEMGNYVLHLFLNDNEISALKKDLIVYGEYQLSESIRGFYMGFVEFIFQYPLVLVLIFFTLFFILNTICVFLVLNYTVKKKNHRDRYVKVFSNMYEEILLSYMFGEIEWEKAIVQLKKIKRKENKKILISILFNFHENLKGEVDKFIPDIFVKLGLHNDSLKASKSFIFHKRAQAIRELTYLYSDGAVQIVPELINDSNDKIRAEAQTAYIRLNPDNPFQFLRTLNKPFARWTQLSAFYLLRLHQLPVPSFANFLYSKQITVRNFSLQMINYFQQLENVSEIFHMLESEIERTRFLSYKAINDLRLFDGKLLLKKKYRNETEKNKLEIVRALKNIGNVEDLDFLEIIIKSESISLKIEACRSMYYMNSEGRERLLKLSKEYDPELELFISHVTDPRN